MFQTIIVLLILIVYILFFLKIRIEVSIGEEIYIDIVVLKFLKVKRFKFNEDEVKEIEDKSKKVAKEEVENYIKHIEFTDAKLFLKNIRELLGHVTFEKLEFDLNVNLEDYILNAYMISFLNSVIAMTISKNINRINTENLYYIITSNEKKNKLNLKCIMYGKLANIIYILRNILHYAFKLKKRGNEKNGKRASDRKFNGNSDVIA